MPFVAIDHTIEFAIDAIIKASNHQQLDQNVDYLKALFNISTGHAHGGVTTDDGPPVTGVADGAVTPVMLSDFTAGDFIIYSIGGSATTTTSDTYQKMRSTKVGRGGTLRIKFTWTESSTGSQAARIYRNGSAVGTERTTPGTYTEDIAGWSSGDTVEIWAHGDFAGGYTASITLFELRCGNPMETAKEEV